MAYNADTDHHEPISWEQAFAVIGEHLRVLSSPDEAVFYNLRKNLKRSRVPVSTLCGSVEFHVG